MPKYISHCENETKQLAAKMAKEGKGHVFALTGELGAGKTVFVQGFAKGLGIKEKIISPTFVLIRQHLIPASPTKPRQRRAKRGEPNTKKVLYHIDLYRLDNTAYLKHLGLQEIWSDPNNIVLIEWAEKAENVLPKKTTRIDIKKDVNKRIITIY